MMERPIIRENPMFRMSGDINLNAAVGYNGFPNIHTYQLGYHQAVISLIETAKQQSYHSDSLIYPILFCARHAIELFLKKQIYVLSDIKAITLNRDSENMLLTKHSLDSLWLKFKELSKIDKRYESHVGKLEPYIRYFCEVDNTGQTFRYPLDKDKERHLTEFGCINIGIFGDKYESMYEIIEYLAHMTRYIVAEYKLGTFVKGLSREQICEIAQRLPNRDDWRIEEFDKVKTEVREKYDISSRTFSRALNLIQEHREFASYIGRELPLNEINPGELKTFIDLYHKHRARYGTDEIINIRNDYTNEVCDSLANDNIYALSALFDISFFNLYSEEYDSDIEKNRERDDAWGLIFDNLSAGRGSVLDHIKNGLRQLGQKTLLSVFE
jgi:hypothetical protein